MRGRSIVGYVWSWQQRLAGSWPGRQGSCCAMSWLCLSSTAPSDTAAFASAFWHQAIACCLCSTRPWPLLSLWPWWPLCQSSIDTSFLQQKLSGSGLLSQSATHYLLCTCRVRNTQTTIEMILKCFQDQDVLINTFWVFLQYGVLILQRNSIVFPAARQCWTQWWCASVVWQFLCWLWDAGPTCSTS